MIIGANWHLPPSATACDRTKSWTGRRLPIKGAGGRRKSDEETSLKFIENYQSHCGLPRRKSATARRITALPAENPCPSQLLLQRCRTSPTASVFDFRERGASEQIIKNKIESPFSAEHRRAQARNGINGGSRAPWKRAPDPVGGSDPTREELLHPEAVGA